MQPVERLKNATAKTTTTNINSVNLTLQHFTVTLLVPSLSSLLPFPSRSSLQHLDETRTAS